ncbi:hypothetical protein EK21DRAFT_104857 [Setomelanomma holmii]|uniref:Uncharacterized protein n=1 Tax=Setomelanomma holmii TaxID=210430 RepID=A0A9P4GY94_9PLEO|nr:hypothetical protein EK21DRAFT_104857 [Setomelanomma holmii]
MLSTKTTIRLFLRLVLILVFLLGSNELRIPVAAICLWAMDFVAHCRLSLSRKVLQYHYCFTFASFWLLAANNDIFLRHHRHDFNFAWRFLRSAFWSGLCFVLLPSVVKFLYVAHGVAMLARQSGELERAIAHVDAIGNRPPWMIESPPTPPPARDTRYMRLADDMIFVCGPGGGFERVVAGEYEGAISRRRRLSTRFA